MTETKNFKLKKPEYNDPADIQVLNDNFDIIDEHLGTGSGQYIIDLYEAAKIIRDSKDARTLDVTDAVDVEALLAAQEAGQEIRFRFGIYGDDGDIVVRVDEYRYSVGGHRFSSLGVMNTFGYSAYVLLATQVGEGWSVALLYWADPMATLVKSVNGVEPDEDGNVDIPAPTSVDMTNYEAGKIRLTYANDEAMDVSVEFDANGNPIKFSNGTEEFTITWPEEVATDE